MSGLFNLLNRLGVLSAARKLIWTEQESFASSPSSAVDGVNVSDSLYTAVNVLCREQPGYRTTRITFTDFDGVSGYTVTLNGGTPVALADGATIAETVDNAVQTLNDNVNSNTIITATAETRDGTYTLILKGKAEADYTCVVATSSGTGVINADLDATSAEIVLFVQPSGSSAPDAWSAFPNGAFDVTTDNLIERFRTAGMRRLYCKATFTGGSGRVFTAPAIEE